MSLQASGWCGPRTYFGALADRLRAEYRTLTIDRRGHGESEPATGDFGVAALVDDAVSLIEQSDARRGVPVAVAHAGWVAIELDAASLPTWSPAPCSSMDGVGCTRAVPRPLGGMADRATTRAAVERLTPACGSLTSSSGPQQLRRVDGAERRRDVGPSRP